MVLKLCKDKTVQMGYKNGTPGVQLATLNSPDLNRLDYSNLFNKLTGPEKDPDR